MKIIIIIIIIIIITGMFEGYLAYNPGFQKCTRLQFLSKMQAATVKKGRIEELHIMELNRVKYLCIMLLIVLMFICHFHLRGSLKQSTFDF